MTVNGAPITEYSYTPGETVRVSVHVQDPNQARWGFQITARSANDNCRSEGTFIPVDGETRVASGAVGPCASPQFATHTFPKTGSDGQSFLLDWTAPATDVGPIIFAAAGNAANGNNANTGDRIYTTNATVQPEAGGSTEPPSIGQGGVVLATLAPTVSSGAPLSIVSIFGQNFAPAGTFEGSPKLDESGKVATELGGVCVEIGNERSPMFLTTPTQLNVQASHQVGLGPQAVKVLRNCGTPDQVESETAMFEIAAVKPAFFVYTNFGGENGANPIAALHGGGPGIVAPNGLFAGATPAAAGEAVSLFATGLGETEPAFAAGEIPQAVRPADPTARVKGAVSVTIGGVTLSAADVLYAGVAPCCAGLYQVVVRVPATLQAGRHPVILSINGVESPAGPFLPVE